LFQFYVGVINKDPLKIHRSLVRVFSIKKKSTVSKFTLLIGEKFQKMNDSLNDSLTQATFYILMFNNLMYDLNLFAYSKLVSNNLSINII